MLTVLLFLSVIVFVLIKKYFRDKKYEDVRKIPGPPPKLFFGNALEFGSTPEEAFKYQLELAKKYGKCVKIWMASQLVLLISDPDLMEPILSSNVHLKKSAGYDGWKPWLRNGLINSSGNYWRRHRKIITPTFHFKILEQGLSYINENAMILISKLEKEVGKKSFDVYPYITHYSLDIISETAMKTNLRAQLNPQNEYLESVKKYLDVLLKKFFSFWKRNDFLFSFTSDYKIRNECVEILHRFTDNVIKTRKEERKNQKNISEVDDLGIKKKIALIDLLLDLQEENSLTDDEIREEIDTFMFAGHDTVTSAISFGLLEIAKYPEIQKRLVEEFKSLIGEEKNAKFTYHDLQKLQYLELVVKELLRINSPVPFFERVLETDQMINGLKIPKGTEIQMLVFAMHRNEEYFPEPEKMIPERFTAENSSKRHPYVYVPFSAGARNCIGQKYAMLSAKAILIKILMNFEILPAEPNFEPILTNLAILKSQNGVHVQLKLRE